jgi:hypothetical protein
MEFWQANITRFGGIDMDYRVKPDNDKEEGI